MKTRLPVPLVGLAISFAIPTDAQQKDLADPQTTQKIAATRKALHEAHINNDAASVAALFTRDAVFVAPEGTIIGRQAIQKWFADLYQRWHPKNCISKVDGNAFHLIGTAGNELWATGESEAFLSAAGDADIAGRSEKTRSRSLGDRPIVTPGGDNENTLSSSPCRIGNQLCFADLRPTKRRGGSTDNPEDPRTL